MTPKPPGEWNPPPDDTWKPDPVLEARRKEVFRRAAAEGRHPTFDELEGLGADLWESDEEFEEFLKSLRRSRGHEA
ncbi:MAG: hypothetical protein K2X87_32775 [Gemmataceae bacterium]|nr:hypothetical protein [Gemmataceae bacterium]